jgi:hypothetical protein
MNQDLVRIRYPFPQPPCSYLPFPPVPYPSRPGPRFYPL